MEFPKTGGGSGWLVGEAWKWTGLASLRLLATLTLPFLQTEAVP